MLRIIVWVVMLIGGAVLGLILDDSLFNNIHSNIIFHSGSFLIGVILLIIVMKISKNTGRTLAKYGRKGNLKKMETNVLVTQGIYKYMRHPMHLGLLFFPLAFAFILGSPSFILIIAPLEAVLMLVMIRMIEEPGAISKFGSEYLEYKKQAPWFCFKIDCIKALLKTNTV